MQEIAAEAGVNQALLHYYFRSKERLSESVFRRAAAELLPRVIEVIASELSIEDKVARVVELELDVGAQQSRKSLIRRRIGADGADQPNPSTEPCGSHGLVRTLATREPLERGAGDRLPGPRQALDARNEVEVDRPDDG